MLHITVTHLDVRYEIPTGANAHDKSILAYAAEAYHYVLPNGRHTYSQFADAIAKVYSLDEPRNRYIVNLLRRWDDAYTDAHIRPAKRPRRHLT